MCFGGEKKTVAETWTGEREGNNTHAHAQNEFNYYYYYYYYFLLLSLHVFILFRKHTYIWEGMMENKNNIEKKKTTYM